MASAGKHQQLTVRSVAGDHAEGGGGPAAKGSVDLQLTIGIPAEQGLQTAEMGAAIHPGHTAPMVHQRDQPCNLLRDLFGSGLGEGLAGLRRGMELDHGRNGGEVNHRCEL